MKKSNTPRTLQRGRLTFKFMSKRSAKPLTRKNDDGEGAYSQIALVCPFAGYKIIVITPNGSREELVAEEPGDTLFYEQREGVRVTQILYEEHAVIEFNNV